MAKDTEGIVSLLSGFVGPDFQSRQGARRPSPPPSARPIYFMHSLRAPHALVNYSNPLAMKAFPYCFSLWLSDSDMAIEAFYETPILSSIKRAALRT